MAQKGEVYFRQVTVIGVGLMGGSLAIAGRNAGAFQHIVGYGRTEASLARAVELGVIDSYKLKLEEAVNRSDLVVIASPVSSMKSIFSLISPALEKGCTVIDLGSVKAKVLNWANSALSSKASFVACHPIAGTERSGVEAASDDLYSGAWCILTPDGNTDKSALDKIRMLWELVGSKVSIMQAEHHDKVLAAISHLPHVVAYALVNTVKDLDDDSDGEVLSFSAGGFKDFTRIASSHPVMWRDICLENKSSILDMIDRFQRELKNLRQYIEEPDPKKLEDSFKKARAARNSLLDTD